MMWTIACSAMGASGAGLILGWRSAVAVLCVGSVIFGRLFMVTDRLIIVSLDEIWPDPPPPI